MTGPSEAQLAETVIAWLKAHGWEVYEEVACHHGRADVVAIKGPVLWVIECKVTFGFAVLEQARRWLGHANLVSVATSAWSGREKVCDLVCESFGIGRLLVGGHEVTESVAPRIWRRTTNTLRKTLRPEHQTYARAGTNGGYYSAWRVTCARLAEVVAAYDREMRGLGLPVKDAVAQITHHYATDKSARACLLRDAQAGRIPGVRAIEKWGGQYRLFPAPPSEALNPRVQPDREIRT